MTREQREALKSFFVYCYERAAQLDDPTWKSDNDLPGMLMAIRANARVGYYEVTGDWLSTIQAGGNMRGLDLQTAEPREKWKGGGLPTPGDVDHVSHKEAPPVADRAARKKGWR